MVQSHGFWTADENGELIGHSNKYKYHYKIQNNGLTAYKTHKQSNRQTQISKFSKKKLTPSQLEAIEKEFILFVIKEG